MHLDAVEAGGESVTRRVSVLLDNARYLFGLQCVRRRDRLEATFGLAAEGWALIQRIYRIEKVAREDTRTAQQRKQQRDPQAPPTRTELRGCSMQNAATRRRKC